MTQPSPTSSPRLIAMTGASGLLGSLLTAHLESLGHRIVPLIRHKPAKDQEAIFWSPERQEIDQDALEGFDAVIHLAGENLFGLRWTAAKKRAILESRERGTTLLATTLARLTEKPAVLISASAVGFYGDTHDAWADENSPAGTGFLAEVCQAWESSTEPARAAGIPVVNARLGVVWSKNGGALSKMLPLFRAGLGGKLGPGNQYMAWVDAADVCAAFAFLLEHPDITGPVNISAPEPATNTELTRTLGNVLGRPTIFPVPSFALRLALGKDQADATLLQGQRVRPARLLEAGFNFQYPSLDSSLRHILLSDA